MTTNGYPHLLRVLALTQTGMVLLAATGQVLFMGGNPGYLAVPVVRTALLLVAVAQAVRGRRWALITVLVLQALSLVGFALSVAVGAMLPWVSLTLNLTGLLTNAVLPAALLVLAVRLLAEGVPARRPVAAGPPGGPPVGPYGTLVWPGGATGPADPSAALVTVGGARPGPGPVAVTRILPGQVTR